MFEQLPRGQSRSVCLQTVESEDDSRDGRGAAAKVLSMLKAFGATEGAVSLAELMRHTQLPKSTAHRMIGFLKSAGLVEMTDGRYALSSR